MSPGMAWIFLRKACNQFMKAHENDMQAFRSVAKRHTLKFYEQPFEINENGKKGRPDYLSVAGKATG